MDTIVQRITRAWYADSIAQNGNAVLADGAPVMSLTAECCKTDPDWTSLANQAFASRGAKADLCIKIKGVEGLEPSRHDLSGSILHHATPYLE